MRIDLPERIIQSAKDFGLGKCYVVVDFRLHASDDKSLLDDDRGFLLSEALVQEKINSKEETE